MPDMMYGKCQVCGKTAPLTRTYFRYDLKCECHSPNHFEMVEHCAMCRDPREPEETRIVIKTDDLKTLVAMANRIIGPDDMLYGQRVGDLLVLQIEYQRLGRIFEDTATAYKAGFMACKTEYESRMDDVVKSMLDKAGEIP